MSPSLSVAEGERRAGDLVLQLPRHLAAESIARRELARWFRGRSSGVPIGDLQQVVSELVTNAVVHGTGSITLEAHSTREAVFMVIRDQGCGFAMPVGARRSHGLGIVDALCEQWGVTPGTTGVWCRSASRPTSSDGVV